MKILFLSVLVVIMASLTGCSHQYAHSNYQPQRYQQQERFCYGAPPEECQPLPNNHRDYSRWDDRRQQGNYDQKSGSWSLFQNWLPDINVNFIGGGGGHGGRPMISRGGRGGYPMSRGGGYGMMRPPTRHVILPPIHRTLPPIYR
jgi:hypothetical protein